MKSVILLLIIVCVTAVFYFSWLPNPDLGTETYLPSWLLDWTNLYYNLRTAVPFVAIGFLLEVLSQISPPKGMSRNRLGLFIQNTVVSTGVVCIAEGGQYFIQNRTPDPWDIFYGILGSVLGSMGFCFLHYIMKSKK